MYVRRDVSLAQQPIIVEQHVVTVSKEEQSIYHFLRDEIFKVRCYAYNHRTDFRNRSAFLGEYRASPAYYPQKKMCCNSWFARER